MDRASSAIRSWARASRTISQITAIARSQLNKLSMPATSKVRHLNQEEVGRS
jgi:hypothetical protein